MAVIYTNAVPSGITLPLGLTYAGRLGTSECSQVRMLEEKCWPMLDEKFDRNQTSSTDIFQHDPTLPNMSQHGV